MCALHRRLDLGISLLEQVYGKTTIEELLDDSDPGRALCESTADPDRGGAGP
jgi:hypothetical protein